jgi:hypothetical protein
MSTDSVILRHVGFGAEIREAELYTEFKIGNQPVNFTATGARSCAVESAEVSSSRKTLQFNLQCSLTWFETEHRTLGPIRIFQDPRIVNKGWILARRSGNGQFETPALSYFNQHLIFHVGEHYLYYPRAWQVVSAITSWPPEYHQYHHLEDKTPVFDLITKKPNAAIKGISVIAIKGKLSEERETEINRRLSEELERFAKLPASKMSPEDLTPSESAG